MDKISKIVAAALFASSIATVTPALAVDTSAREFTIALSADFSNSNYATIQAKLAELQQAGIEGILVDDEMISIARLMQLLNDVQAGNVAPGSAAATLLAAVTNSEVVRFITGGIYSETADLNVGVPAGSVFPAGSAG